MQAGLYVELNLLCISILVVFFIKMRSNIYLKRKHRLMSYSAVMYILFFTCDFLWKLIDTGAIDVGNEFNYIINSMYFSISGFAAMFWVIYCSEVQNQNSSKSKLFWGIAAIPAVILLIMSVNSPFTEWIYYLDENGAYHRGNLYLCQIFIVFGYLVFSIVYSLYNSAKKENQPFRKLYSSCTTIPILVIAASTLQIWLPDYPLVPFGVTVGFTIMYLAILDSQVMVDKMTMLYNRNWFYENHIQKLQSSIDNRKSSIERILLIDIDGLRLINDSYGKDTGDDALIRLSKILEDLSRNSEINGYFRPIRFGDDEFIVLCEFFEEDHIESVMSFIESRIRILNASGKTPYKLSISMGHTEYAYDTATVVELMNLADQDMYRIKVQKQNNKEY